MRIPVKTMSAMTETGSGTIRKGSISLLAVCSLLFVFVSSGAYGVEDMISISGPGISIIMLIFLGLFWGAPYGLVCSELSAEYPGEGGIYIWVREAFGEFWGYLCGWWYTVMLQIDTAVYLVLITGYVKSFMVLSFPAEVALIIGMALICAYINFRGIEAVGFVSIIFTIITLTPFLILTIMGFAQWRVDPLIPIFNAETGLTGSIGLALVIGVWMYSGYEAISSMGDEIEGAKNLIQKAMVITMPFVMLVYILPTVAGLASAGQWENWAADAGPDVLTFIEVGGIVGGKPLMMIFLVGAIVSQIVIYNDYIASASRGPFVMADDNLFPKSFVKLHKKFKTPYISILFMSAICVILAISGSFSSLIVIDVFLYMFALILMFLAAIKIRYTREKRESVYRLPVGNKTYAGMNVFLSMIAVITLFTNGLGAIIGGTIALISGPVTYFLFKEMYGGFTHRERFVESVTAKKKLWSMLIPFYGAYQVYALRSQDPKGMASVKRMTGLGAFVWILIAIILVWSIKGNFLELLQS